MSSSLGQIDESESDRRQKKIDSKPRRTIAQVNLRQFQYLIGGLYAASARAPPMTVIASKLARCQ
jgi:hypothetical protein